MHWNLYFGFQLLSIVPSLKRPNRARMLATRTHNDEQSLSKKYASPLPPISTKECKFKIGDHVVVPMRDKRMVTGIVRWTGVVRLSSEAEVVIAVGVETVSKMTYYLECIVSFNYTLVNGTERFITILCSLLYNVILKEKIQLL